MNNPQDIKTALLKVLAEKGDWQTLANIIDRDEQKASSNKLTKLIEPMSAVADILTSNAKGSFMEDVDSRVDKTLGKAEKKLEKAVRDANDELKRIIEEANNTANSDLSEQVVEKVEQAKANLEQSIARYADTIVSRKASEMFATLGEQAKLTEAEKEQMIMDSALQVESQLEGIIGAYVAEQGITVSQIKDFEAKVKALIPEYDFSKLTISASQIRGLPDYSGAASRIWVEKKGYWKGGGNLTVSATAPSSPSVNDLWVEV